MPDRSLHKHQRNGFQGHINQVLGLGRADYYTVSGGILGTRFEDRPLIGIPLGLAALRWVPKSPAQTRPAGANKKVTFRTIISRQPVLIADYALIFMTGFVVSAMSTYLPQLLERIDVSDTFIIGLYVSAFTRSIAVISLLYGRIKTFLGYGAIAMIAVLLGPSVLRSLCWRRAITPWEAAFFHAYLNTIVLPIFLARKVRRSTPKLHQVRWVGTRFLNTLSAAH